MQLRSVPELQPRSEPLLQLEGEVNEGWPLLRREGEARLGEPRGGLFGDAERDPSRSGEPGGARLACSPLASSCATS